MKYVALLRGINAIAWRARQADFNKSGMSKLVGTDLYIHMTVRNVNTFRKIAELLR